jgi:hypothetical protein
VTGKTGTKRACGLLYRDGTKQQLSGPQPVKAK